MRKRFLSEEQREHIVRLRKSGAGWLRIETMTRIPRRTAKRAFEEYQQKQSEEEIQTARRQVAADLFQSHLRDLIITAKTITASLSQPDLKDRRDGNTVIDQILVTNIRNRGTSRLVMEAEQTDVTRRQNRTLLNSLKQHTRGKIDWQTLDNWRTARNEWQNGIEQLRSTSMTLIRNFIQNESHKPGPAIPIKWDEKLIGRMADGIVEAVHRAVVDGKLDHIEKYINSREHQGKVLILFGENVSTTELIVDRKELAEKVVALCRKIVKIGRAHV